MEMWFAYAFADFLSNCLRHAKLAIVQQSIA
jgi:hypothetical protein